MVKTYMGIGNTVKVTYTESPDVNKIGIITNDFGDGFVRVDFGTHIRKHNVNSLLDLSIQ